MSRRCGVDGYDSARFAAPERPSPCEEIKSRLGEVRGRWSTANPAWIFLVVTGPPCSPRWPRPRPKGQLTDRLLFYSKPKLLIVDDLGYLPFERRSAHLFLPLVARRYERGSLLITANQVFMPWGAVFDDEVLTAAILDRLLHHSHTLMIQGESYRLKPETKAGLLDRAPPSRT
jgi:hypothetical protein